MHINQNTGRKSTYHNLVITFHYSPPPSFSLGFILSHAPFITSSNVLENLTLNPWLINWKMTERDGFSTTTNSSLATQQLQSRPDFSSCVTYWKSGVNYRSIPVCYSRICNRADTVARWVKPWTVTAEHAMSEHWFESQLGYSLLSSLLMCPGKQWKMAQGLGFL